MTQAGLWLLRLLALLPLPLLRRCGSGVGVLLYALGRERRQVTLTNLELCFPHMSDTERERLARAHFRAFAQSFLERSLLWHASPARLKRLIQLQGLEHLEAAAGRPVILLTPHFVGLDAGWTRLTLEKRLVSVYANQKNPLFNEAVRAGRLRFGDSVLLSRQDGIRSALRELKTGLPFYYLPDMDFGPRDALFIPFFGVPAATVTAVARLAALSGALIIPCTTRMHRAGYAVTLHPAWNHYPDADLTIATRRVNLFIEEQIPAMPEQYLWMHKRFKTRPPGEERFYQ